MARQINLLVNFDGFRRWEISVGHLQQTTLPRYSYYIQTKNVLLTRRRATVGLLIILITTRAPFLNFHGGIFIELGETNSIRFGQNRIYDAITRKLLVATRGRGILKTMRGSVLRNFAPVPLEA